MATAILEFPTKRSEKAVAEITAKENFVSFETTITAGSKKGDNYLGQIYRVKIEGKKKDGSTNILGLIIKAAPQSVEVREKINLKEFFLTEMKFYTTISPTLSKLQDTVVLNEHEKFKFIKCYECCDEDLNEILIMEDLAIGGFKMYDRKTSLDINHAKIVVEVLARLHALSFVMKKRDPTKFKALAQESKEQLFVDNGKSNMIEYLDMAKDKAIGSIENVVHREKLKSFTNGIFGQLCELMSFSSEDPYRVLCHGDSWTNNFLFKYSDGKPVDIRILDWQIIRYSSPVSDLIYLIFACTDSDFRNQHYEELLQCYHTALEKFLGKFSIKVQEVYPMKVFKNDLRKYSLFGMGMAIMTLLLFTCESDDAPDISQLMDDKELSIDFSKGQSAILYNSRINGVVSDYIKYGYL